MIAVLYWTETQRGKVRRQETLGTKRKGKARQPMTTPPAQHPWGGLGPVQIQRVRTVDPRQVRQPTMCDLQMMSKCFN